MSEKNLIKDNFDVQATAMHMSWLKARHDSAHLLLTCRGEP